MRTILIAAFAWCWTVSAPLHAASSASDDAPPSQQTIQKTFDEGDYGETIQLASRALALKGDATATYDRYEVLMLKGEAHLRLRQLRFAGDAFAAAASETDDEVKAARARATRRLIRESKGLKVQRHFPKKDGPQSADLLDPGARDDALAIAYDDLRTAAAPKIKAALRARTLPPISEALERLGELHDIELASTGGDAGLLATRHDLGERAQELIGKELDRLEKSVLDIRESANTVVEEKLYETTSLRTGQGSGSIRSTYRGLSERDRGELKSIIKTCLRIIPTADALARATTGDPKDVEDLVERSKEVGRSAERVLSVRY